jgi:hypothetical protein
MTLKNVCLCELRVRNYFCLFLVMRSIEIVDERDGVNVVDVAAVLLLHVLVLRRDAEVLKHVGQELKSWPLHRITVPAFQHNLK